MRTLTGLIFIALATPCFADDFAERVRKAKYEAAVEKKIGEGLQLVVADRWYVVDTMAIMISYTVREASRSQNFDPNADKYCRQIEAIGKIFEELAEQDERLEQALSFTREGRLEAVWANRDHWENLVDECYQLRRAVAPDLILWQSGKAKEYDASLPKQVLPTSRQGRNGWHIKSSKRILIPE